MDKILNYINGKLVAPNADQWLENYEPAKGQVYSLIPDSDSSDVELAVAAAHEAAESWGSMRRIGSTKSLDSI